LGSGDELLPNRIPLILERLTACVDLVKRDYDGDGSDLICATTKVYDAVMSCRAGHALLKQAQNTDLDVGGGSVLDGEVSGVELTSSFGECELGARSYVVVIEGVSIRVPETAGDHLDGLLEHGEVL
jgi:hypothetical protein